MGMFLTESASPNMNAAMRVCEDEEVNEFWSVVLRIALEGCENVRLSKATGSGSPGVSTGGFECLGRPPLVFLGSWYFLCQV